MPSNFTKFIENKHVLVANIVSIFKYNFLVCPGKFSAKIKQFLSPASSIIYEGVTGTNKKPISILQILIPVNI